jgi:hypothetical protein
MTTVGYGDIYPQTHFGRFFGVVACLIGMLLVSYLIVGMSTLFDFTPQEHRAYEKLKKLTAGDAARHKAANVIKTAMRARRYKKMHEKFIFLLLLKQHINVFSNSNKVAHSRMLPTDQMIKMLEEKMRQDVHETREKGYIVVNYEQKVDEIKRRDVAGVFEQIRANQSEINRIIAEYNN